jgi:hypothetical protein
MTLCKTNSLWKSKIMVQCPPLFLEIMACRKTRVIHFIIFICNCDFIYKTIVKHQNKSKMTRGVHLKQVDNEAYNNAKSCKMVTILPLKSSKFVSEEEEHWKPHIKP